MKRIRTFGVWSACFILLITGCAEGNNKATESTPPHPSEPVTATPTPTPTPEPQQVTKPKDPVELTIVPYWLSMNDDEYETLLFEPLRKVHPHITMKVDRTNPTELAASGNFPDLFYVANVRFYLFRDLDIPYDLSEMIKASQIDLDQFARPNIDWVMELGEKGEIFGLPFDLNHMALFYNKDLFDKRGVTYPEEGLFWEDMLDLSRRLTFVDGDVQYRGFIPRDPNSYSGTKTLPVYDPVQKKALLYNEEYQSILRLVKSFYDIPDIIVNGEFPIKGANFLKDQTVAMMQNWLTDTASQMMRDGIEMNFDITGVPSFRDLPGVTIHPGAKMMGISKSSKYKEDAFLAIEFFVSEEVQRNINRGARLTALADNSIRQEFGTDVPVLKGKNVAAALRVTPAKMIPPHEYNAVIDGRLNALVADMVKENADINTLLRRAQEEADQAIMEAEAAKK